MYYLCTGRFECDTCGRKYRYRSTLRTHQRLECGKEPQNECSMCMYRCYQPGPKPVVSACHSSVAHFVDLSHSDDDMYPNLHDMLDLTVVEGGQVMDMYEDLEGPFTIFCNICNTGFKHISSLRYHEKHRVCLKPKKDSSDPRCPKCDKVFATVTGFQYHMKRNVCENIKGTPLVKPSPPLLRAIVKVHLCRGTKGSAVPSVSKGVRYHNRPELPYEKTVEEVHSCEKCQTTFKHRASLLYHVTHNVCLKPKKEEVDPKALQCHLCDKVFSAPISLTYHLKNNVCTREAKEPKEGRGFFMVSEWGKGVLKWFGRSPLELLAFQCASLSFQAKGSLEGFHASSIRICCIEKSKKSWKVAERGFKFKHVSPSASLELLGIICSLSNCAQLITEVVEEEKECHLCKTVFKHPNSLRYHLEHNVCLKPKVEKTEPKVLQCEKCSKVFSGLPGLEYHMKRKVCEHSRPPVPGPPFVCDICNMSFDLKQTWYAHVKRQVCKKFPEKYMKQPELETINVKIELDSN
ncbi:hypothetical protein HUJ04_008511 [Dendroctonus ponderosae]|nr:hypothetical protein HUJ04_008511 [Dendroctonus ponderosae]